MKNKVLSAIEEYNMLENGGKVIVALSGGADSVCLLHMLISIKEQYNLTVAAAHLNHNIRGEEAKRDADFVRALCLKWNIKLFEKSEDIVTLAGQRKQSLELCGREVRYDFFAELAKREKAKIATAHTASDNLETVVYNIARGTSVSGLKGIAPKRNYIIRPLISVTRREVEAYCLNNRLSYVTDSTNLCDDYTRNKIRHRVVPVLENINPAAEEAAYNLSRDAEEVSVFLNEAAALAFNNAKISSGNYFDAEKLRKLSPVVQKCGVCLLCKSLGVSSLSRKHIALCRGIIDKGGRADLNGGFTAICSQGVFRIVKKPDSIDFDPLELKEDLSFRFSGKEYFVIRKRISESDNRQNLLDYSVLEKNPVFRLKQPGDFIRFSKRKVTKTLKKFLNEEKVPSELRNSLLLLADGSEILWLQGFGAFGPAVAEKCPDYALEISFRETSNNP